MKKEVKPISKTTLAPMFQPLMGKPSIKLERCAVCGRTGHLEQHHIVKRSAGEMYDENGRKLKKPTITLCGHGNIDGCHGLAHAEKLHFRWHDAIKDSKKKRYGSALQGKKHPVCGGYYEILITKKPTKYEHALEAEGWERMMK